MPYSAYECGQRDGEESIAYVSISYQEHAALVARWYNAPHGRCILLRPPAIWAQQ